VSISQSNDGEETEEKDEDDARYRVFPLGEGKLLLLMLLLMLYMLLLLLLLTEERGRRGIVEALVGMAALEWTEFALAAVLPAA